MGKSYPDEEMPHEKSYPLLCVFPLTRHGLKKLCSPGSESFSSASAFVQFRVTLSVSQLPRMGKIFGELMRRSTIIHSSSQSIYHENIDNSFLSWYNFPGNIEFAKNVISKKNLLLAHGK